VRHANYLVKRVSDVKYNSGRIDDIISAFNTIQQNQEEANEYLRSLSETVSAINEKVVGRMEVLKTQVYVFSNNMGWLGIWDIAAGNYKSFVNTGISNSGEIRIAGKSGDVFLLGSNGNQIYYIDPYFPGVKGSLLFEAVTAFEVSPDGKRLFISQENSSILLEIDVVAGNIKRKFVLPGTGQHLIFQPETNLLYFSVAGTQAVYSIQYASGKVMKVFDLPGDAVKMAPYKFGGKFGLMVLSGSGDTAAITKWDKSTNKTSTVQVANASEMVVNPFTGQNYVVSLQNVIFRSWDGTVLKTVDLGDTARQLTLTVNGNYLIAVISAGSDALIVDTITGTVSTGPQAIYPSPALQPAELFFAHAQFGFVSN